MHVCCITLKCTLCFKTNSITASWCTESTRIGAQYIRSTLAIAVGGNASTTLFNASGVCREYGEDHHNRPARWARGAADNAALVLLTVLDQFALPSFQFEMEVSPIAQGTSPTLVTFCCRICCCAKYRPGPIPATFLHRTEIYFEENFTR